MKMQEETITAIATARGNGAIGIIRIDGARAVAIANTIFSGKLTVAEAEPNRMHLGAIVNENKQIIDQVLICKYLAPNSYTGEDLIEINCHGGLMVLQQVLDLIIRKGARIAKPGEFSQRAFINGKLDLLQAEAVADLISSTTEQSRKLSMAQLQGRLSHVLMGINQELQELIMLIEINLDFSDEDIQVEDHDRLLQRIIKIQEEIAALVQSFAAGKIIRDGAKLVLIGRPNVGKSSLLNRLLKEERAIVTEVPGTTRDTIEEGVDIKGIHFRIVDTAGIRQSNNRIEIEGVNRTFAQLETADILCIIFDGSEPLQPDDIEIYQKIQRYDRSKKIFVQNKADLDQIITYNGMIAFPENLVKISTITGQGLAEFEDRLSRQVIDSAGADSETVLITRQRHKDCLLEVAKHLAFACSSMQQNYSHEFVAADLRAALTALGELTGVTTPVDILNKIFSEFCIGK